MEAISFVIQILAGVLLLIGMWQRGNNFKLGSFICAISCAMWAVVSIIENMAPMLCLNILLFLINVRNTIKEK